MEGRSVLVDSSWWIEEARAGRDPVRELLVASHLHDLVVCGVVRCEVARGIRSVRALEKLRQVWDVMVHVPTDNRRWTEAEELLWSLDRRGHHLPLPVALIAVCALAAEAAVLTLDKHFWFVPGLRASRSFSEL